ncbi:MAG: hypothetical protein ACM3QZ_00515 [Solirubrobacterales bacterium]
MPHQFNRVFHPDYLAYNRRIIRENRDDNPTVVPALPAAVRQLYLKLLDLGVDVRFKRYIDFTYIPGAPLLLAGRKTIRHLITPRHIVIHLPAGPLAAKPEMHIAHALLITLFEQAGIGLTEFQRRKYRDERLLEWVLQNLHDGLIERHLLQMGYDMLTPATELLDEAHHAFAYKIESASLPLPIWFWGYFLLVCILDIGYARSYLEKAGSVCPGTLLLCAETLALIAATGPLEQSDGFAEAITGIESLYRSFFELVPSAVQDEERHYVLRMDVWIDRILKPV